MAVRQPSQRKSRAKPAAPAEPGLAAVFSTGRLFQLLKERDRLVRQVEKKKAEARRAADGLRAAEEAFDAKVAPLREQDARLRASLEAQFAELLAPGRLSARARKEVLGVRAQLELQGVLWADDGDDFADDGSAPEDERSEREPRQSDSHTSAGPDSGGPTSRRDVAAAAQHGQSSKHESLRILFRRLVLVMHPDRARHEEDRQTRTHAMKEATRAYEDGDLARLVELEEAWRMGTATSSQDDEARVRELERTNRELRAQIATLTREQRQLKRAMPPPVVGVGAAGLFDEVELALVAKTRIRDFIQLFCDGRLTLSEFVHAPLHLAQQLEVSELIARAIYDSMNDPEAPGWRTGPQPAKSARSAPGKRTPRAP